MELVLRDLFSPDIARYICQIVNQMYFKEWRDKISRVHSTLATSMYCVKWTIEFIKYHGEPSIVGCDWNGGYHIEKYTNGIEVHAVDDGSGFPEYVMCVECATFVNDV